MKAPKGGGSVCSSPRTCKLFERMVNPEKIINCLDSTLIVNVNRGLEGPKARKGGGVCVLLPGAGNFSKE